MGIYSYALRSATFQASQLSVRMVLHTYNKSDAEGRYAVVVRLVHRQRKLIVGVGERCTPEEFAALCEVGSPGGAFSHL